MQREHVSMCNSNIIIIIANTQYTHKQATSHSRCCLLRVRSLRYPPMRIVFRVEAPQPRNFSKATTVYFCSPVRCVPAQASPAQLSSAQPRFEKLIEQLRKGPLLQMEARFLPARGSEGLAACLEPQPLTG